MKYYSEENEIKYHSANAAKAVLICVGSDLVLHILLGASTGIGTKFGVEKVMTIKLCNKEIGL